MTGGPLAGVRVIDLTTVVVGPICTRTLADYGAEVIKVEAPGGDLLRTMAEGSRNPGMSGKFINFNRNKRSIGLDIKKPKGLAALLRLIDKADVFVSNVRPEGLARLHEPLGAERAVDPLLDPGLRPRRALLQPAGLRSDRAEPVGRGGHARPRHRRAALRAHGDERPCERAHRRAGD